LVQNLPNEVLDPPRVYVRTGADSHEENAMKRLVAFPSETGEPQVEVGLIPSAEAGAVLVASSAGAS
jgi:hypothetical protein